MLSPPCSNVCGAYCKLRIGHDFGDRGGNGRAVRHGRRLKTRGNDPHIRTFAPADGAISASVAVVVCGCADPRGRNWANASAKSDRRYPRGESSAPLGRVNDDREDLVLLQQHGELPLRNRGATAATHTIRRPRSAASRCTISADGISSRLANIACRAASSRRPWLGSAFCSRKLVGGLPRALGPIAAGKVGNRKKQAANLQQADCETRGAARALRRRAPRHCLPPSAPACGESLRTRDHRRTGNPRSFPRAIAAASGW